MYAHILILYARIHYNLFYAINLSERSFCGVAVSEPMSQLSAGQQSLHKYSERSSRELTAEQSEVVNHRLQPGEVIKVMAFAGTGKTTTLLRFTALNPNMSFLYCVYNKSVQEHAATIFPCNVKCRTFHSLAHGSRGDPVAVGVGRWAWCIHFVGNTCRREALSTLTTSHNV
jgi:F-box protein 18 (helicase)